MINAEKGTAGKSLLRKLTPVVFGCAVLGGIAFGIAHVFNHRGVMALSAMARPSSLPLLLTGVAAYLIGLVCSMFSWQVLVIRDVRALPATEASRMFFIGMAGKFLPGRVWGVLAHLRIGRELKIPTGRIVTAYTMSLVVTTVAGAAVGALFAADFFGTWAWLLLPGVVAVATALVLRPCWLNVLVRPVHRRFATDSPEFTTAATLRRSLLTAFLSWVLMGVHLWLLAVLLGAPVLASLPVAVSGYALASVVGTLSFVLPDGWGAREAALAVPLATVLPWSAAAVAVMASRLLSVLSEATAIGATVAWTQWAARRRGGVPTPNAVDAPHPYSRPAPPSTTRG